MTHEHLHPVNTLICARTPNANSFLGDCIASSTSVCLHTWKEHGDRRGRVAAAGGSGRSGFGACCWHGAEPHCCSAQASRSKGGTFPTPVRGPHTCVTSSIPFPTGLTHPSPTLHRRTATDSHSLGEPQPASSTPFSLLPSCSFMVLDPFIIGCFCIPHRFSTLTRDSPQLLELLDLGVFAIRQQLC